MEKVKRGCVFGGQSGQIVEIDRIRNGSSLSYDCDRNKKYKSLEVEDGKNFRISCSGSKKIK